jgi:hypothetical protein
VHPCFPVIDKTSFWSLWQKDPRHISPTLLCDVYAVTLAYWDCSEKLRGHSRPDIQFIWNQAVLALRDEFTAPSMGTIHAALLDMLGRPIYHITGNNINAGHTVSLAHSQGLHRDPSKWRVSDTEKKLRTNVLWALVIHDHWHGGPTSESICTAADPSLGPAYPAAHLRTFQAKTTMLICHWQNQIHQWSKAAALHLR